MAAGGWQVRSAASSPSAVLRWQVVSYCLPFTAHRTATSARSAVLSLVDSLFVRNAFIRYDRETELMQRIEEGNGYTPAVQEVETEEWLASLNYVLHEGGPERVLELFEELKKHAARLGIKEPFTANTAYVNTIPPEDEPRYPGNRALERRIKSLVRWNAMAMVVRANKESPGIGGHISTYASAATLYEVGIQPLLPRPHGRLRGRSGLLPGPQRAGHVRACLPGGTADAAASGELPPRAGARRRPVVVSAPVADGRFLAGADGLHGSRTRSWRSTRRASCVTWKTAA